eukprot:c9399_g1_i1.p1 GENE.c9399_g1_i1~~c9399_g1_i1.p1  ORF type:complete len:370 (+),score=85.06 c9399_g1_i1:370-1479(+)
MTCTNFTQLVVPSCTLLIGNQTFTRKSEHVSVSASGSMWKRDFAFIPAQQDAQCRHLPVTDFIVSLAKAAERVSHISDNHKNVTGNVQNGTHHRHAESSRWIIRQLHSAEETKRRSSQTLNRLAPLRKGFGTVDDMANLQPPKKDIGESAQLQVMSCAQMMSMETSVLASSISNTLSERIRMETTFPSFIIRPLMTVLLAPISQQIEKKTGPFLGPILALLFTMALQIPLACHLVGYLCHQMGFHLSNVLIESLTYKSTDYIITALEGTLARDISGVMMTALARWFIQTVVPEVSNKISQLMPGVVTPGLASAVSNGVTMAITKPLTHALKGPVLAYYYCEYCYTYGTFCEFCSNDDLETMNKSWWLDI